MTWSRWSHACCKLSVQVSMATQRAVTTRHCHTDKSVDIITDPHTYSMCKGKTMKTKKAGQSGSQKALNYGKQDRQTGKKQLECNPKAPAAKPVNAHSPPPSHGCRKLLLSALAQV